VNIVALDTLIAAEKALIAALDGDDAAAIERGTTAYAGALDAVRGQTGWTGTAETKAKLAEARMLADAARARVNILADRTRQRLSLFARAAGKDIGVGYGRNGRLRA
jgi:predicted lipoprotein